MESSPKRKSRHDAFLKRQEKRWAKKAGPVTVRQATPEELARLSRQPQQQPPARPAGDERA